MTITEKELSSLLNYCNKHIDRPAIQKLKSLLERIKNGKENQV